MEPEPFSVLDTKTSGGLLWRLQAWLQGWPHGRRAWPLAWLGNRVSDVRYYSWRLATALRTEGR